MTEEQDRLYAEFMRQIHAFRFDDHVARVFTDMIRRSVPGYGMLLEAIAIIAERYVQPHSCVYDLGCSLGAVSMAVAKSVPTDCRVIAVDNSPAMLERFRALLSDQDCASRIETVCADITQWPVQQASLVVLNFTLQFIPVDERLHLLQNIYTGMLPGGVLILSEKILAEDNSAQTGLTELHHAFKKHQGYSELEIAQKRTALENVLIPETVAAHRQRLTDAGFGQVWPWFQYFNFVSLLAVK